jgi:glucose-1-phosphate thymidylyltransferase
MNILVTGGAGFVGSALCRHLIKIACPEEIAYRQGFISADQMAKLIERNYADNGHGIYLRQVLNEEPCAVSVQA